MLTTTRHDLRYSFRALLKNRNFTVAALVTLALGIRYAFRRATKRDCGATSARSDSLAFAATAAD